VFVGALALAAPAGAVTCANLQTAINGVANGGTVTVNQGTCTGMSFTLPSHAPGFTYTIQGAGTGATFDGGASGNRILTGTDVGIVTLRNLTFENSTAPTGQNGGAVDIEGNSGVTIDSDRFFGNKVTGGTIMQGGAIHISSTSSSTVTIRNSTFGGATAASGNSSSGSGGAVTINNPGATSMQVIGSVFRRNTAGFAGGGLSESSNGTSGNPQVTLENSSFTQNSASADAGGAVLSSAHSLTVERNAFSHNSVVSNVDGSARGGALLAVGFPSAPNAPLTQIGNRFDANHIGQDGLRSSLAPGGGGEWVGGLDLTSRNDRFTSNSLAQAVGGGAEAEGGGLGLEGCGSLGTPTDVLENLVAAGNQIAGEGHGAGVYGGGCGGGTVHATVLDSTISGNRETGAGGSGGLAGGSGDTLKMRNSVVTANVGASLEGFATRTITNTDACVLGSPAPGPGNICKPPKLANPAPGHADVHETTLSPTINAGSNLFVPGPLTTDFEGQPRILNGVVDMGADEFKDGFGGVPILSKKAKVKKGKARVKVRCPKTAVGHCTGKLTLRSGGHGIGSRRFSIAAGKTKTLKVPLTRAAKVQLELGPLDHVLARTNAHDDIGTKKRKTRHIELKLAG